MNYDIYDTELKARAMLGDALSESEERMLESACLAACAELSSRLRRGVRAEDLAELFTNAAAILAVSMYSELNIGAENIPGYIKAGDLSIRPDGVSKLGSAAVLRQRAENMLAGYLKDGSFSFQGVDG